MFIWNNEWITNNVDSINKIFETEFKTNTKEDRQRIAIALDCYNSVDEFNNDFEGLYLNKSETFEILSGEGYATEIDNKYIYFNEINYDTNKTIDELVG